MFTKILEAEIEWCEENDGAMPKEYRKGFVAGLKQAIYLINAARERIRLQDGYLEDDEVLEDTRVPTTDAPEMTVGDSSPINEHSTDETGGKWLCRCKVVRPHYLLRCVFCGMRRPFRIR